MIKGIEMSKKNPTLGVFLCNCGGTISKVINFKELAEFVSKFEDIKFVKEHGFLCGEEGLRLVADAIRNGVERIVIVACSPKLYEPMFKEFAKEMGLNPYFLEMANIREQCAWPHRDNPGGAKEKAKKIVAAAVSKVQSATEVERKEFPISKSVLVIGGGVAGLQAAMDVADFGYEVHLIERASTIGGNALKLGLAFPTDDGAFCISSPNFLRGVRKCFYRAGLLQHPNLKIHTLSEVKELDGSFGDFKVKVLSRSRGVVEHLCNNCGECAKVCPVEVDDEMNYGLNKRKAIYQPHPNAVPSAYVIDWENCNKCGKCVKVCSVKAIKLEDEVRETMLHVGAIVVATGFQEYDPSEIRQYKYGLYKDVITQLQLARILDPYGPTGGELVRPSDGKTPKNIVIIQCVGSRDLTANPYCSRVCCTIALKHALIIKERYPDAQIYLCYMDIRTVGKDYEEYFSRAREKGIKFIRGKPAEIIKDEARGVLIVEVEDTLLDRPLEIEADMVVLSMAMVPTVGSNELAKTLGIQTGNNGFIKDVYQKLKTVETNVKGIYVCGGAHSPKDIPDSVTQAEATAFRVILELSRNSFEKDCDTAYVNEDDCDGCELCVEACPYDAIKMVESKDEKGPPVGLVARIDEIKCERCGSCAGKCPTGAIQLRNYTDQQMLSQISELLHKKNGESISPTILAFCCDECGYATIDMVGMGGMPYPVNILPLRVPCLGWVSLYQIFKAFEYGADGILLVGCILDNCQHRKGGMYAGRVVPFAKSILDEIGLSNKRLQMVNVCAATPLEFSRVAKVFVEEVKKLGPIKKSMSIDVQD